MDIILNNLSQRMVYSLIIRFLEALTFAEKREKEKNKNLYLDQPLLNMALLTFGARYFVAVVRG